MIADSATFDLPPVMKLEDCQKLHTFLQEAQGSPVTLNCADVTRLTGMSAQLIQMASNAWTAEGQSFDLSEPSEGCAASLANLGLDALLNDAGDSA